MGSEGYFKLLVKTMRDLGIHAPDSTKKPSLLYRDQLRKHALLASSYIEMGLSTSFNRIAWLKEASEELQVVGGVKTDFRHYTNDQLQVVLNHLANLVRCVNHIEFALAMEDSLSPMHPLQVINGVGPKHAVLLAANGYWDVPILATANSDKVRQIFGFRDWQKAEQWIADARTLSAPKAPQLPFVGEQAPTSRVFM